MRIVGGEWGGRRLVAPRGLDTRPTSDRVREALFSILFAVDGVEVLDLFAGTGALALEALSRGAARAVLVEHGRDALAAIAKNVDALAVPAARIEVLRVPVNKALALLARQQRRFDLVFADPPYADATAAWQAAEGVLDTLLSPGARLIWEHSSADPAPPGRESLRYVRTKEYGEAALSFFEAPGENAE